MTIVSKNISGNYLYKAAYLGTSAPKGSGMLFAGMEGTPQPPGPNQVIVDVAEGVPFLCGYAVSNDGVFPAGVTVTVIDPDGNALEPVIKTDKQVVFSGSSVSTFMIGNPAVGKWTLNATFPGDENGAHLFMSTVPTQDVAATMMAALTPHTDADTTVGCAVCKAAAYAFAAGVAALAAISLTLLTPESAAVVALASFLGLGVHATVAALVALGTMWSYGIGAIAANFCAWIGACPSTLTVAIKQPSANAKESGTIVLQAVPSQTSTVTLTVDAKQVGVVNSSPWQCNFDTKTLGNGSYTLAAIAVDAAHKISALANPIQFTVNN